MYITVSSLTLLFLLYSQFQSTFCYIDIDREHTLTITWQSDSPAGPSYKSLLTDYNSHSSTFTVGLGIARGLGLCDITAGQRATARNTYDQLKLFVKSFSFVLILQVAFLVAGQRWPQLGGVILDRYHEISLSTTAGLL
jgi:hypothetical protein